MLGTAAQQDGPRQAESSVRVEDTEQRSGPFAVAGQGYTTVLHEKRLISASGITLGQTVVGLEIRDAAGNVSYEKDFSYVIDQGRFQRTLSASPQFDSGKTGTGLVIRYSERIETSQTGEVQTNEFWQLFGFVNGKVGLLGKPVPIGEGLASGPFMGVMMRAANGAVSVIDQPDTIEVRAWTGNFYVFVPLRVDWNHGGLAQGQRCVERLASPLQDVGCPMRVEANRKPSAEEFSFVRLFTEAHENPESAEHVVLQKDSTVEILGSSAITTWNEDGGLIQPIFADIWLHVRVDNRVGWIHGDDFTGIGLPDGSPAL
jgi:hypothetical protein